MNTQTQHNVSAVAELNDNLRINLSTTPGANVVFTPGVLAKLGDVSTLAGFRRRAEMLREIARQDEFTEENDPHGKRDFGTFELNGETCFWKIDYYDLALQFHSPDASDPNVTVRVMTIMLGSEY